MGRFRATIARSEWERDVHRHLAKAMHEVRMAHGLCVQEERTPRLRSAVSTLQQVIALLDSIRSLTPTHDRDDPDLRPEHAKTRAKKSRPEVK
jgi:hypothetical protein